MKVKSQELSLFEALRANSILLGDSTKLMVW